MKKIFLVPLSMLSISLIFAGCANNETTADIGRRLDSNLNNLTHIVTKLDVVDNNYIANPDLSTSAKTLTAKANDGKIYSLAFAENYNNTTSSINDLLKQLLYNKLSERLTQNNDGKCRVCNQEYICDHDGFCNNCNNKIICDNMGNCTNCGRHLVLTHNNKCANCNNTAVISESKCSKAVQRISAMDNNLVGDTLSARQIVNDIKNDKDIANDNYKPILLGLNDTQSNESFDSNNKLLPKHQYSHQRLKYNPRHITDLDSVDISAQIDSYIDKVQKLYTMSNDTIEANSILSDCKNTLLETVASVKQLNKEVINGTCVPSVQQVQALKNYIEDINTTVKRLKNCNGDITKQMNKINQSNNTNVTTSVDVMNSNYISLLNHIDTRIAYHESAITTLEQIKYLLEDAINNGTIDENQLLEYTEELGDITKYGEQQSEQNVTTKQDDETTQEENNDNKNTSTYTETNTEYTDQNNTTENQVDESEETINNQTDFDGNNIIDDTATTESPNTTDNLQAETNNDGIKNIDTYNQAPLKNIDTYKNNNVDNNNATSELDVENNNNNIDTNNINNSNSTFVENDNLNNNSQVFDNNNEIDDNNSVNNATSNQLDDNNMANQNNNILYQNGVINDNNLNTQNNLQNRYYYGNDGKIYNNTTTLNDSNHLGNGLYNNTNGNYATNGDVDNNINNNGEGLNNVNTYGYSSILDAINQGTVNNGINTL